MTPRSKIILAISRAALIAATASWWVVLFNACFASSQAVPGRIIPFSCPGSIAFVTPMQRNLLYGLIPACLALVVIDRFVRKRWRSR